MRKLCLLLALIPVLAASCAGPRHKIERDEERALTPRAAHHAGPWQQYLLVMSERERIEFLNIIDDGERRQWLRNNGIDVRAELSQKLARGLTLESAKMRLNDPIDLQEARGDSVMLYCSRFNGESRTNYYLKFESNQLVNWSTYTIAQQDRTLQLITFEAEIMRRLDIVLKPGMGAHTIQQMAAISRKRLDDVLNTHREKLTNTDKNMRTDYKRRMKIVWDEAQGKYVTEEDTPDSKDVIIRRPSSDNYIVQEQVVMATAQADFLGWFAIEPNNTIIHRPFETHQFYIPYKSKRGKVETVIVEFSFKDGLLEQWFVYHDE